MGWFCRILRWGRLGWGSPWLQSQRISHFIHFPCHFIQPLGWCARRQMRCIIFVSKTSAVRGMFVFVSGIQAAVRGLKHGLRPVGVGIRQSAAPWHRPYAQMGELARFRKHRISNLAQCVDFSDHSVKHYGHMLVGIKALYVAFTILLAAEFENFFLVEQIYQLTIHRLSAKMCTFVHSYLN